MERKSSPLGAIYAEIEKAIEAQLWYAAITIAVALPDICSTLEGAGRTNWQTYKDWFDRNAATRFRNFGKHECYELRCGVMHNGVFQGGVDKHSEFEGVYFLPPGSRIILNDTIMENIGGRKGPFLIMSVVPFCEAMIAIVKEWEVAHQDDEIVATNMEKLVRVRPEGLSPLIVGLPVIA